MVMIIPFLASLYWTIMYVVNHGKSHRANQFVVYFFATTTMLYFGHIVYFTKIIEIIPFIEPIYILCHQAVYPLALLYILKLTKEQFKIRKYYYVLVPAVILAIISALIYAKIPTHELKYYVEQIDKIESSSSHWGIVLNLNSVLNKIFFIFGVIVFVAVSQRAMVQYRNRVMNFYSNSSKKDLRTINILLYLMVIQTLVSIISISLGREFFLDKNFFLLIAAIMFAVVLFLLGYFSFKQSFFIDDLLRDELDALQISEQQAKRTIAEKQLVAEIKNLFESEKIYLNPNLTIITLLQRLGTNRTYLSNAINNELSMNFNQLVNRYRTEEAKKLLMKNINMKLSEIALLSGFANEEVFFRNFKKIEKTTPTAWKKEQNKELVTMVQ